MFRSNALSSATNSRNRTRSSARPIAVFVLITGVLVTLASVAPHFAFARHGQVQERETSAIPKLSTQKTSLFAASPSPLFMSPTATYTVDNTGDNAGLSACTAAPNDCSLRGAIATANGTAAADTIEFDPTVFATLQTISLGGSALAITPAGGALTINGGGKVRVSGNGQTNVFQIFSPAIVSIDGLSITDGKLTGGVGGGINNSGTLTLSNSTVAGNLIQSSSFGAGIYNANTGTLTIVNSTISFNTLNNFGAGAGIYNDGLMTVTGSTINGNTARSGAGINSTGTASFTNCTISGNTTTGSDGGGIRLSSGTVNLTNTTITGNTAVTSTGGGISASGTLTLHSRNSIIAGNSASSGGADVFGTLTSQGYNLIGNTSGATINGVTTGNILNQSAQLGPLQNNGGSTFTQALTFSSPARNAGSNALAVDPNNQLLTTDQRGVGFPRIFGGTVDMGAYEYNGPPSISDITDKITDEDTATGNIAFTVSDLETPAADLVVTGTSANQTLVPNANITFGGSGANRTVNILPALNQNGSALITVTVTDGDGISTSDTFTLTVNAVNDAPLVSGLIDRSINEDTATGNFGFTVSDAETTASSLLVSAVSNDQTLVPNANVTLGGAGASRTINILPAPNRFGQVTITVSASDGQLTGTASFVLTVNSVSDTYLVDNITDNGALSACTAAPNDCSLRGAIATANGDTVAFDPVVFGSVRTITLGGTPLTITHDMTIGGGGKVRVSGGGLSRVFQFNSGVVAVLNGLTITGGASASGGGISNGGTLTVVNSTVSGNSATGGNGAGIDNNGGTLNLTNSTVSGNTAINGSSGGGINNFGGAVSLTNVTISGNSASGGGGGVLNFDPSTVNARNTIIAGNTASAFAPDFGGTLSSQGCNLIGSTTNTVIAGATTGNVLNQNAQLAPLGNYGGGVFTHALLPGSPALNAGSNAFALDPGGQPLTTDGRGGGFPRIIGGAVDIGAFEAGGVPSLSDLGDTVTNEDTATGIINFSVSDAETPAANLIVTATSGNQTLVPNGNIALGGSGTSRTINLSPALNQSGSTVITVTVTDSDGLATSDTFTLTVNPVNDLPTISGLADTSTNEDTPTGNLPFTVGDIETAPGSLIVSATSNNQTVVPNANITLGGSGANRTINVLPASNQFGAPTITVTVMDGDGGSTSVSFVLTINSVVDTFLVDNTTDNGGLSACTAAANDCSLRGAIALANSTADSDMIAFDPAVFSAPQTITISGSPLTPANSGSITILGRGLVTVLANNSGRVFQINSGVNTTLDGLIITGGNATRGGGIDNSGILTLSNSTVSGNQATGTGTALGGGGIFNNSGTLTVTNSAISGNSTTGTNSRGGGIAVVGGVVTITNSTISGNTIPDDDANKRGGGINSNSGTVNLINSTVSGNISSRGAGIANGGTLNVVNSTISDNTANLGLGGGIMNAAGTVNLTNATIANNFAESGGGGVLNSATFNSRNSIIAGNTLSGGGGTDFAGSLVSQGYNLISNTGNTTITGTTTGNILNQNAQLGPLQNNGGPTFTRALLPTSPARNAGNDALALDLSNQPLTTDQRGPGFARRMFGAVDMGAYEYNDTPIVSDLPDASTNEDTPTGNINFTVSDEITPAANLVTTATSSNQTLVPNGNITLGGSGANRTLRLTPAPDQFGTTLITVFATDGDGLSGYDTFTLTVIPVNDAPTISAIAPIGIFVNSTSGNVNFTVGDAESPAGSLLVTATSQQPALIPNANLILGGSGANRTINITPAPNLTGSTTITITVSDGMAQTNAVIPVVVEPVTDTFIVDNTTDDPSLSVCSSSVNDCSLRGAISKANASGADNTILFAPNLAGANITLGGNELAIANNGALTIDGGNTAVRISGNNLSRVFNISIGAVVTLNGLTITGGNSVGGSGISNAGTLTVTSSTISDNTTDGGGGGISNSGSLTVTNSTISGNSSSAGGGIANGGGANLTMINSTISGNSASRPGNRSGGGISNSGTVTLFNVTVVGNSAGSSGGGFNNAGGATFEAMNSMFTGNDAPSGRDMLGTLTSQGFNLIGVPGIINGDTQGNILNQNPLLTPLGNYGGPTQTHALLPNSPALNAGNDCILNANGCGNNNPALITDQRGGLRKTGSAVDIGSFESSIAFNQGSTLAASWMQPYNLQLTFNRLASRVAVTGNDGSPNLVAAINFAIVPISGQGLPPGLALDAGGNLAGTPTTLGDYTFTVVATDTDGMAGAEQFFMRVLSPTSALVSVSGRVLTPIGLGLTNASVILTDQNGAAQTVVTGGFGYYRFDGVESGRTYVLSINSKRYSFEPQVVSVMADVENLNFTASP